jgi:hypothetical protein
MVPGNVSFSAGALETVPDAVSPWRIGVSEGKMTAVMAAGACSEPTGV